MTLQMVARDEALRTEATAVGLLAGVNALVDVEVAGVAEGLGAVLAGVGLAAHLVAAVVDPEGAPVGEAFVAQLAGVRLVS